MPATVRLGDSGEDVRRLQRVLVRSKALGPADLDGHFGPKTDQAVRSFQQGAGLVVDGIVGPITWSHLPAYREASPDLAQGALGPVVARLQKVLATGFSYGGAIDGIYGPLTAASVRGFQQQASLPVTGAMNEPTWLAPAGGAGATLESLAGLLP
jgi:peptidoglycan hydrolase-like protein with peptidoglycan-binding domain